jgi:hypothetical protein
MDHINEQWQSYWAARFAKHGYEAVDCIRPRIYGHPNVEWWYQQNILLFCAPGFRPSTCPPVCDSFALDRVHPQVLKNLRTGPHSGREALTAIRRGAAVLARKAKARVFWTAA